MLTNADIARALRHLDYPNLTLPTSLALGEASVTQARFIAEANIRALPPEAEGPVIAILDELDCVDRLFAEARGSLIVVRTGGTQLDAAGALDMLGQERRRLQDRLADAIGAQRNPVSNARNSDAGFVIEGY